MVRAKFKLNKIERTLQMMARKDENGNVIKNESGAIVYEDHEIQTLVAAPVYSSDPDSENKKFWDASPGGELRLNYVNAEVFAEIPLGSEFYLDFTPAE